MRNRWNPAGRQGDQYVGYDNIFAERYPGLLPTHEYNRGNVSWQVCKECVRSHLGIPSEDTAECKCYFKGPTRFLIRKGQLVFCAWHKLPWATQCTCAHHETLPDPNRTYSNARMQEYAMMHDFYYTPPCLLQVSDSISGAPTCSLKCVRTGCENNLEALRHVMADHLLPKAFFRTYLLAHLSRAVKKTKSILRFRQDYLAMSKGGLDPPFCLESYFIDGHQIIAQPESVAIRVCYPNFIQEHQARMATWQWAKAWKECHV